MLQQSFYKYPSINPFDEQWGFYVMNAGHAVIPPGPDYPIHQHPASHQMPWQKGRRLHQYHLLYITQGEGYFEAESAGFFETSPGSLLLLYPGEWHRYRPDPESGWHEYWLGFDGHYAQHVMECTEFSKLHPHFDIGLQPDVVDLFSIILEKLEQEELGYQQTISALAIQLLGRIANYEKYGQIDDESEQIIQQSKCMMQAAIHEKIDPQRLADELNVGYSWFRRMFKIYTGFSPVQYHLNLKMQHAKHLLASTHMPVKTIAFHLNFQSHYYFSRLFKTKTGLTPTAFRKQSS